MRIQVADRVLTEELVIAASCNGDDIHGPGGPLQREPYLQHLTRVHLEQLQLATLDATVLSSLPNLTHLYLQNNRLVSIAAVACLPALQFLALAHNQLTQVEGLRELSHLLFLDLSHNQIAQLSVDVFPSSITFLQIAGNPAVVGHEHAVDAALIHGLPKLKYLDGPLVEADEEDDGDDNEAETEQVTTPLESAPPSWAAGVAAAATGGGATDFGLIEASLQQLQDDCLSRALVAGDSASGSLRASREITRTTSISSRSSASLSQRSLTVQPGSSDATAAIAAMAAIASAATTSAATADVVGANQLIGGASAVRAGGADEASREEEGSSTAAFVRKAGAVAPSRRQVPRPPMNPKKSVSRADVASKAATKPNSGAAASGTAQASSSQRTKVTSRVPGSVVNATVSPLQSAARKAASQPDGAAQHRVGSAPTSAAAGTGSAAAVAARGGGLLPRLGSNVDTMLQPSSAGSSAPGSAPSSKPPSRLPSLGKDSALPTAAALQLPPLNRCLSGSLPGTQRDVAIGGGSSNKESGGTAAGCSASRTGQPDEVTDAARSARGSREGLTRRPSLNSANPAQPSSRPSSTSSVLSSRSSISSAGSVGGGAGGRSTAASAATSDRRLLLHAGSSSVPDVDTATDAAAAGAAADGRATPSNIVERAVPPRTDAGGAGSNLVKDESAGRAVRQQQQQPSPRPTLEELLASDLQLLARRVRELNEGSGSVEGPAAAEDAQARSQPTQMASMRLRSQQRMESHRQQRRQVMEAAAGAHTSLDLSAIKAQHVQKLQQARAAVRQPPSNAVIGQLRAELAAEGSHAEATTRPFPDDQPTGTGVSGAAALLLPGSQLSANGAELSNRLHGAAAPHSTREPQTVWNSAAAIARRQPAQPSQEPDDDDVDDEISDSDSGGLSCVIECTDDDAVEQETTPHAGVHDTSLEFESFFRPAQLPPNPFQ